MYRLTRQSCLIVLIGAAVLAATPGCGTTKSRIATEQLLMSDAVDNAVGAIDFRPLAGEKVFFDTRYLINVKGVGFVNAEYIISSLRQQLIAADVRLQDKAEEADFIVEARVGTLGTDGNEIVYGVPANRGLSEAAAVIPNAPVLPAIPELSLARKESQTGAVKVAAFAYARQTGEPFWQSGMARARTSSQDVWVFGAGPFQNGSIHDGTKFAGTDIRLPGSSSDEPARPIPNIPIDQEFTFHQEDTKASPAVQQAGHVEAVKPESGLTRTIVPQALETSGGSSSSPAPTDDNSNRLSP